MAETTTVSIRISAELLEHIDQSAAQAGLNRTTYLLSWLPDYHAGTAEQATDKDAQRRR